ncbi:MAG: hypothetical protein WCF54_07480 [Terracidiphilus sp.]
MQTMRFRKIVYLLLVLSLVHDVSAQQGNQKISLCLIQQNPESYLHFQIEVNALLVTGIEGDRLFEGTCQFRVAYGDNYQTFGNRFNVDRNANWDLFKKLMKAPNDCSSSTKRIRAIFAGVVERVPATGTRSEDEMPLEIVLLAVSDVERVLMNCTITKDSTQSQLTHESRAGGPVIPLRTWISDTKLCPVHRVPGDERAVLLRPS